MAERIWVVIRKELTGDPVWGPEVADLSDEMILEVAAEDWFGLIEDADKRVVRDPVLSWEEVDE